MRRRLFIFSIACAAALAGISCDRKPSADANATSQRAANDEPAIDVSVPGPATAPASAPTTQQTNTAQQIKPSVMMIDQKRVEFPPAKLRVISSDGKVVAKLYSDDPHSAIDDKYTGNSFYFEMELDAPQVRDFAASVWRCSSSVSDHDDTPYGVFLDGRHRQLQPLDVKVEFQSDGDDLTTVAISGRFLVIDIHGTAQPGQLPAQASLAAVLSAKTTLK